VRDFHIAKREEDVSFYAGFEGKHYSLGSTFGPKRTEDISLKFTFPFLYLKKRISISQTDSFCILKDLHTWLEEHLQPFYGV